jgi:hypothetical protein
MKKKSIIVIATLFCIAANTANAQEKWQFRFSYGLAEDISKAYLDYPNHNSSHFRIDLSRETINHLHIGLYAGYSQLGVLTTYSRETHFPLGRTGTNAIFCGLNFRYQLMPLFTGRENSRFELYPVVKIGFVHQFWRMANSYVKVFEDGGYHIITHLDNDLYTETDFELGFGFGAAYNFTRRFGVFGEGTFGQFVNDQNFRWHVGVKFNF